MSINNSLACIHRAKKVMPAGVNSPVRAFSGVNADARFIDRAQGPYLYDVDGNQMIDYVGSWGPMIAGHAHPDIVEAVSLVASKGLSFGASSLLEVELAEKVIAFIPSIEMIRMVNSGTEATTTAIRLARGWSGRDKILKFVGCYHGHCDALLVKSGSGLLTFNQPDSAGIPESVVADTLLADYNNLDQVKTLFHKYGDQLAAVIVEPVAGNMGMVLPNEAFLPCLRHLCDQYGSVLIFDEVMTGFRVAKGGAQAHYNVKPDLTALGKIIGGGCPVGALGGRADIMTHLAPLGPVYQAGTLSGNPLAMTAGIATLNLIDQNGFYELLSEKTKKLMEGFLAIAKTHQMPLLTHHLGGMFGFFFTDQESVNSLEDVKQCDNHLFKKFHQMMLERGIYLAPSMFEAGFVSQAHGQQDINDTLNKVDEVMHHLA